MTQAHDVIVITSCTNRKRRAEMVLPFQGADMASSLHELAQQWSYQVQAANKADFPAAINLYAGRSIVEAKRTAEALAAPLFIVSAGHGLVRSDERIPSYNITVSAVPGNPLHHCLDRLEQTPAQWWQALVKAFGKQRSLAALFAESSNSTTLLLAVPAAYLALLSAELTALGEAEIRRLRIITSPFGAANLSARLQATVMPYDERLEGLTGYAGTRSDFPQRALRHFATVLGGHTLSLEVAHLQVRRAMEALRKPVSPERERRTDEEITDLLRQNWQRFNGSASALLRFLRDEALVSCEQSRFRILRQQVLTEVIREGHTHG